MVKEKIPYFVFRWWRSWALIQVKVLIDLFGANVSGYAVLKNFDLVTANSGGSIVTAGLIENYTLAKILDFFLDANIRKSIFSQLPWFHQFEPYVLVGGLASDATQLPCTDTSIFCLNPFIHPTGSVETGWRCPDGFTPDEFKRLVDLDMAAIKNEGVALITRLCNAWMNGLLKNQHIRGNKALIVRLALPTIKRPK